MTRRQLLALFSVISFFCVAPMLRFGIGGDAPFQIGMIDCFARQFWQGDFFPSWCFTANDGLGSPLFIFYHLLPFYISSLLYPLTHLGLSTDHLYVLCCFLATL